MPLMATHEGLGGPWARGLQAGPWAAPVPRVGNRTFHCFSRPRPELERGGPHPPGVWGSPRPAWQVEPLGEGCVLPSPPEKLPAVPTGTCPGLGAAEGLPASQLTSAHDFPEMGGGSLHVCTTGVCSTDGCVGVGSRGACPSLALSPQPLPQLPRQLLGHVAAG